MKKLVTVLIVMFLCFTVFASQRLFTQDCEEVKTLYRLFREGQAVMPSYVFPVSGDVLLQAIEYSDIEQNISSESQKLLKKIISELSGEDVFKRVSDDFAFDADVSLATEFWYPSAEKEWVYDKNYGIYAGSYKPTFDYNNIPAFLKGGADLFMTDYAVGHFEYEYSKNFEEYDDDGFQTNVPFGFGRNSTVPYNTYLNIGVKKINLFAGRVRNSSGSGITGNLSVGDNFLFRNTIKAQINVMPFSYELVVNRFDAEEYADKYKVATNNKYPSPYSSHTNLTHISQLDAKAPVVVMHKANMLIGKKLNIGLYEAMMDYSKATIADPKLLGPFNLMHNYLSYQHDTNNFFGFDFDWAAIKGLNIHGEMMFDQIQLSDEKDKKVPGAFGVLLNGQYSRKINNSFFTFYTEAVYTSPWLYLKPAGDYGSDNDNYHTLDLIVGNFHMHDAKTDTGYLGYKYGPNTVVANLGAVWEKNRNKAKLDMLLKFNGDTGFLRKTDMTQTGEDEYVDAVSPYIFKSGKAQTLFQMSVSDSYDFFGDGMLMLNAAASLQLYKNFNCVKGIDHTNFVFACGAIFHPLKMLKGKK